MRKFFYILFLLFCVASMLQAKYNQKNEMELNSFVYRENLEKNLYQIITANQTIYINQIPNGSYLMVFDALGRNVFKSKITSASVSIPLRGKGVYIIRIQKDKVIYTEKILVR